LCYDPKQHPCAARASHTKEAPLVTLPPFYFQTIVSSLQPPGFLGAPLKVGDFGDEFLEKYSRMKPETLPLKGRSRPRVSGSIGDPEKPDFRQ
jgi:hypothetical protein